VIFGESTICLVSGLGNACKIFTMNKSPCKLKRSEIKKIIINERSNRLRRANAKAQIKIKQTKVPTNLKFNHLLHKQKVICKQIINRSHNEMKQ